MDEKGIQLSEENSRDFVFVRNDAFQRVNARAGGSKQAGNRQTVTALETSCSDGTMAPPFIIFPGGGVAGRMPTQYVTARGRACVPRKSRFAVTQTGWSNSKMSEQWAKDVYVPWMNAKKADLGMKDRWAMLVFDGHSSHLTHAFLRTLSDAKVLPVGLPAHTSDKLQPNDVALFGPLSRAYKRVLNDAMDAYEVVSLRTFLVYYGKARETAFTVNNIRSAFSATGIVPLNPLRIDIIKAYRESRSAQPSDSPTSSNEEHTRSLADLDRERHFQAAEELLRSDTSIPSPYRAILKNITHDYQLVRANNVLQGKELATLRKSQQNKEQDSQGKRGRLNFARAYSSSDIEREEAEQEVARLAKEKQKAGGRKRGRPAGSKKRTVETSKAARGPIMLKIPARVRPEAHRSHSDEENQDDDQAIGGNITSDTEGSNDSDFE